MRPHASALSPLKTVVSGSVTLFLPAPGIIPPWIPRAVPLPPASPVATEIFPCAATRGAPMRRTVARPRICMLGIWGGGRKLEVIKLLLKKWISGERRTSYESIVSVLRSEAEREEEREEEEVESCDADDGTNKTAGRIWTLSYLY